MKKISKRIVSLLLLFVMVITMAGCKDGANKTSYTEDEAKSIEVLKVGDEIITIDTVYLYVLQYLYTFKIDVDAAEKSMEQYKQEIISQLRQDEILYQVAKENGIELTEEAVKRMNEIADSYYDSVGKEFFEQYGISKEAVINLFMKQRYITELKDAANLEFVDIFTKEANERYKDTNFCEMYYLLFPTIEVDENSNYKVDANNEHIPVSAEKKAELLKLAEEAQAKAVAGTDMEELAKEYDIEAYSDHQVGYDGLFPEELNQLIRDMKTGDISQLHEDGLGYMVVKMLNHDSKEVKEDFIAAYAKNKSSEESEKIEQYWLGTVEVDATGDMIGDTWENFDILPVAKYLSNR